MASTERIVQGYISIVTTTVLGIGIYILGINLHGIVLIPKPKGKARILDL